MKKHYRIPVALATLLVLGIILVNTAAAAPLHCDSETSNNESTIALRKEILEAQPQSYTSLTTFKPLEGASQHLEDEVILPTDFPDEVEQLRERLPSTFKEAESCIKYPSNRFLLWTFDLRHVLWGRYQSHIFIGRDNLGRNAWGLYGNGYFVGRYGENTFFWGRYHEGLWKARGLFHEDSWGRYLTTPRIEAVRLDSTDLHGLRTAITLPSDEEALASNTVPFCGTTEEIKALRDRIPNTLEKAEASIPPLRTRYIMWTHDLKHVMWGRYGSGYFVGTDNQWKRTWGIYGNTIFAGLYDGTFFIGRYGQGQWCARYLFGERWSQGRFLGRPSPTVSTENDTW
jgi:hypothetical protein